MQIGAALRPAGPTEMSSAAGKSRSTGRRRGFRPASKKLTLRKSHVIFRFHRTGALRRAGQRDPLAFHHYDAGRRVLGKTMAEHLRFAVCYWHTFVWPGADMFGQPTFERPWQTGGDAKAMSLAKADAAFDFFSRLGAPFYTFHDTDVAPEGSSLREYVNNFAAMLDVLERKQQQTGIKLLWGTANLFSHPRYAAGAATSPQPEVFAYAATQVAMRWRRRSAWAAPTTCCGVDARAMTPCSTPTSGASASSWAAS